MLACRNALMHAGTLVFKTFYVAKTILQPMNFLSHFYIDKNNGSTYYKLGIVLPDLIANYNRRIRSNKIPDLLEIDNEEIRNIKTGIKKHHQVDKIFHNSEFFKSYQALIKGKLISYQLPHPFFIPHLFLEIILDRVLLLQENGICKEFYSNLKKVNFDFIEQLFSNNANYNHKDFCSYIEKFMKYQYLFSYREKKNIIFAINRICERIGLKPPYNDKHSDDLELFITEVEKELKKNYQDIFLEINNKC